MTLRHVIGVAKLLALDSDRWNFTSNDEIRSEIIMILFNNLKCKEK